MSHADSHTHDSHAHDAHSHDEIAHPLPMSVLINTFLVLLVLTFLTVAAIYVDLGPLNIWIALFIALIKAAVVGLYFMHLRYDSPFNSIVLVASLLFVVLFIGIALMDTFEYAPNLAVPPVRQSAAAP